MITRNACGWLAAAALAVFSATQEAESRPARPAAQTVHYVEIVSRDVDAQCEALAKTHGLRFGDEVADLGNARVAEARDGTHVAVRAPLADHDAPIVRTYLAVDDIEDALEQAKAAGAVVAYGPARQGKTGTWAIYILGEAQVGLWQR